MRSRSLTTHEVRLMGQKVATSLGDLPAYAYARGKWKGWFEYG